jgi:hypothetical protein
LSLGWIRKRNVPGKADTTSISTVITKDASRADLEGLKDSGQLVLIEVARNVGHIEISVLLIRELLELGVEGFLLIQVSESLTGKQIWTYASETDFITKMMKATNAILSILEVVILDEAKSARND